MNMHDGNQQLPFPSCLPAFYALAIPMSCCISNVFYYLFVFFIFGLFWPDFFFSSQMTSNVYTCGIHIVLFQIYIQQWSSAAVAIKINDTIVMLIT